jgi:hypothetical protein
MNSLEYKRRGYLKVKNPSGEFVWIKRYDRILPAWDNLSTEELLIQRQKLAEILQVPVNDLMADLEIIVHITKYPRRHSRFSKVGG